MRRNSLYVSRIEIADSSPDPQIVSMECIWEVSYYSILAQLGVHKV